MSRALGGDVRNNAGLGLARGAKLHKQSNALLRRVKETTVRVKSGRDERLSGVGGAPASAGDRLDV